VESDLGVCPIVSAFPIYIRVPGELYLICTSGTTGIRKAKELHAKEGEIRSRQKKKKSKNRPLNVCLLTFTTNKKNTAEEGRKGEIETKKKEKK